MVYIGNHMISQATQDNSKGNRFLEMEHSAVLLESNRSSFAWVKFSRGCCFVGSSEKRGHGFRMEQAQRVLFLLFNILSSSDLMTAQRKSDALDSLHRQGATSPDCS